jgi:hypothetical protein
MYKATLWHIHVTIVAAEMQQCILYFFPHFLIHGMISGKKEIC